MRNLHLLTAVLMPSLLFSAPRTRAPKNVEPEKKKPAFALKGRVAAFRPQSDSFRQIYGNFWPEYSGEFDWYFHPRFSLFTNAAFAAKSGKSLGLRDLTRAYFVPVTVGINWQYGDPKNFFHPYLGAGVGAIYTHFKNDSPYVQGVIVRWGLASLFQAGIELDLTRLFFLDLFASYRLNWVHFTKHPGVTTHQDQTGGLQLGAGLGVRF